LQMPWRKLTRASFRDQDRLWRIGMKIVEERIFAGVEGPEHEGRGRPGREDLLLAQLVAFEFGGRIAIIAQLKLEPPVGWYFETLRHDVSILELDCENWFFPGPGICRAGYEKENGEQNCREVTQAANLRPAVQ
jgi:hypothetical protein